MRKMLQNKKGFTLVELMIVVVIMGILVAVAVPVYNSVTKNAKKKSCDSNINVLKSQAQSYMMTGDDGSEVALTAGDSVTLLTSDKAGATTAASSEAKYVALLQDGVPVCPFKLNGYTITATNTNGAVVIAQTQAHDDAGHGLS